MKLSLRRPSHRKLSYKGLSHRRLWDRYRGHEAYIEAAPCVWTLIRTTSHGLLDNKNICTVYPQRAAQAGVLRLCPCKYHHIIRFMESSNPMPCVQQICMIYDAV